eukprot:scaffold2018_cov113-Cylindrotheca_fusiformis.AAC.12
MEFVVRRAIECPFGESKSTMLHCQQTSRKEWTHHHNYAGWSYCCCWLVVAAEATGRIGNHIYLDG